MTPETIEALKASAEHWRENAKAERPEAINIRSSGCALCKLFIYAGCYGCPLVDVRDNCPKPGSTWRSAMQCHVYWDDDPTDTTRRDNFRTAATAMADKLESLLPTEITTKRNENEHQ